MATIGLYIAGLMGLMFGEIFIFAWFVACLIGLKKGETTFKVSFIIPIIYLIYVIPLCQYILSHDTILSSWGSFIPLATRQTNALIAFIAFNLTTPLFPILAWLKHRKIESIKASGSNSTSQKAP